MKPTSLQTFSVDTVWPSSTRELPSRVAHSVGVAVAGLPRIVSSPQLTSTRTINKGGSTHLRTHTEHIRTGGDWGRDGGPGANRTMEGARWCGLVKSIHPSRECRLTGLFLFHCLCRYRRGATEMSWQLGQSAMAGGNLVQKDGNKKENKGCWRGKIKAEYWARGKG